MPQPAAASDGKAIKALYDEGMKEVFKVIGSMNSTNEQVRVANQTAEDLTSLLVKHTLASIDERSALLAGLIVELNQVIDAVKKDPPYAGALDNFTTILTKAKNQVAAGL